MTKHQPQVISCRPPRDDFGASLVWLLAFWALTCDHAANEVCIKGWAQPWARCFCLNKQNQGIKTNL